MEKLKDIIRNNRMCTRPEYYSGRGATLSDLNSDILIGIHKGIKKEFGEEAAKGFVEMVKGIKVMSATTFLQELYSLYYANWEYKKKQKDASGILVAKNEDGSHNEAHAMVSMMGILGGNNRDDTPMIKGGFCRALGLPMKDSVWHNPFTGVTTYYG